MTLVADAFGLTPARWARHANPWSVRTRVPILPLLALALWARVWIGVWCLVPVAALLLRTAVNPRAFPPPRRARGWASRAVFGERLWVERRARPIPPAHARTAAFRAPLALLGLPPLAWGLWALDAPAVLAGLALVLAAKVWFLDGMVRLFDAMAAADPAIARWQG